MDGFNLGVDHQDPERSSTVVIIFMNDCSMSLSYPQSTRNKGRRRPEHHMTAVSQETRSQEGMSTHFLPPQASE